MLLTAEEFQSRRFELPEGGSWCELLAGELVQYQAPDEIYGNVVLRLSKALAQFAQSHPHRAGAICFDLGVIVERRPDTLLFPAVSHFAESGPFELSGEELTERVPNLVVEIASTPDRRRYLAGKIAAYLRAGVDEIWTIDETATGIEVVSQTEPPRRVVGTAALSSRRILDGFQVVADQLFAAPEWWNPGPRN